jgi:hypothetical protein
MNRQKLILLFLFMLDLAIIGCTVAYAAGAPLWVGVLAGILFIAAVILTVRV